LGSRSIPPGCPEVNGKVERSHKSDSEEFYQRRHFKHKRDLARKLKKWETEYNEDRSHLALYGKTPAKNRQVDKLLFVDVKSGGRPTYEGSANHQAGCGIGRSIVPHHGFVGASMKAGIAEILGGLGHVVALCPQCGQIFHLSEAGVHLDGKRPHTIVDILKAAERKLERDEEKLSMIERELRERAAMAGLRITKKLLKKINPLFSGAGYDPQDVKVIFDPVTYVIFDGMSNNNLQEIVLLANPRATSRQNASRNRSANRSKVGTSNSRLCMWTMRAASLLDRAARKIAICGSTGRSFIGRAADS